MLITKPQHIDNEGHRQRCPECGALFWSVRNDAKRCSGRCRMIALRRSAKQSGRCRKRKGHARGK